MANKFNATLDKLKKAYSDTFADINEAGVVKRITLDSPQMNFIFGGGFAKGRMYELFGPESAGKSTICTYLAMQNQKHNEERPMVMYIDFERSFDRNHAVEMGLDVSEDKFLFLQPYTGEDAFAIINEVIQDKDSPVGLIVWDSIGATPTKSGMEDMFKACVSPDTEVEFIEEN